VLKAQKFDEKMVIHDYGFGGAGMSLAWGCRAMVAELALERRERRCGRPGMWFSGTDGGASVATPGRSGPPVSGTYEGGDARSIRFVVGDQVKVFPISDVVSMQFDNPTAKQPSSSEGLRTPSEPAPPSTPDVADKQLKFWAVISDYRDANTRYANEPQSD
jgi:hypothetical protein